MDKGTHFLQITREKGKKNSIAIPRVQRWDKGLGYASSSDKKCAVPFFSKREGHFRFLFLIFVAVKH